MISPCPSPSPSPPGQRAENAAGEDREARGEICESGALQQDPHGGGMSGMEDVHLKALLKGKDGDENGATRRNSLVNSHVHKSRHWHTAFAGSDTGMMYLFIDDAECNRFSPRNILPGYFWEYILHHFAMSQQDRQSFQRFCHELLPECVQSQVVKVFTLQALQ